MPSQDSEKTGKISHFSSPTPKLPTIETLTADYQKARRAYPDALQIIQQHELFLPTGIFVKELSALEAISKYLVENCGFSLKQIAQLLNRTNKNIWHAYNSAGKKYKSAFEIEDFSVVIPTVIIADTTYSVLQNIVLYLKDILELRYADIAKILHRDDRTIWTTYHSALKTAGRRSFSDVQKYTELTALFTSFHTLLQEQNKISLLNILESHEAFIPADIFSGKLGSLQSITKYLTENYHLSATDIAKLTGRSGKNISAAYRQSYRKQPAKISAVSSCVIPATALAGKLGVLETLVTTLHARGFSYRQIASFLSRDEKTVWTVSKNARKKLARFKRKHESKV